jgi:hypothetical protein
MIRPALLLALLLTGCASLDSPTRAVLADGVTTKLGLAAGAKEVGAGYASIPIRLALNEYAKTLPDNERVPIQQAITLGGVCAAVNNGLVLLGAPPPVSLGAFGVCLVVGWNQGAEERERLEFAQICAHHRITYPNGSCLYKGERL